MAEKSSLLPVADHPPPSRVKQAPSKLAFVLRLLVLLSAWFTLAHIDFSGTFSRLRQVAPILSDDTKHDAQLGLDDLAHKADSLCLTPGCVHAASELLYNLSPDYKDSKPCEDFEEMVCGGWRERHDLRSDQGHVFEGTLMSERSQTLLRHILEAGYPRTSMHSYFSPARLHSSANDLDKENFEKLKDAYKACLDEEAIKKVGIKPLMQILNDLSHHEELPEAMLYLAYLGIGNLLTIGPDADAKDPDTVVVYLMAPYSIGLPAKEYYEDEDQVEKYTNVIATVFSALYSDDTDAEATSSLAKDLVQFEKALAAASPDEEDMYDITKTYHPMSLSDAEKLVPQIGLSKQLKKLVPSGVSTNRVIVSHPAYAKSLKKLLDKTSKTTISAFLQWKTIQSFANDIAADALKPLQEFNKILVGQDPKAATERWRTCVRHVDDGLGWFLSRFYIEKAFSAEAKRIGDEIISDIKDQFAKTLNGLEWMEDEVKALAIQKVRNIVQKVGYPTQSPDITDPAALHEFYESVKITESDYFENVVALRHFDVDREWSTLGKPVDRNKWEMTADTVNAYYSPSGNEIVFPAAIMQFPVFSADVPQYLSYGAFGSVAGHELTHAFDVSGRHFDQNGNYTDWWTNKTVEEFEPRAQCFVSEYNNFTFEGPTPGKLIHVNGKLTQGENIADAGGISASFAAWKTRAAKSPIEANLDLPGLEFFTHEQLFFVNYANWWCGKSTKQSALQRIFVDPHAPEWARVLGVMKNSRDFREAFGCPVKEPTCELW